MNFHDQIALTLRTVSHGHLGNWRAFAALAGMIVMIGGMVAMMWFLSQPVTDMRGWLCGAASIGGLFVWRAMLPLAVAQDQRDEDAKRHSR
jgi:hypothetical protein